MGSLQDDADLRQGPPEEAPPGLLAVHGPGLHPEVLQVEGHRCKDGLAAEQKQKREEEKNARINCTGYILPLYNVFMYIVYVNLLI